MMPARKAQLQFSKRSAYKLVFQTWMFLPTQATTIQFVSAVIVMFVDAALVQRSNSVKYQLLKAFFMKLRNAIQFVLTKVRES